jgi:hypothetical protein
LARSPRLSEIASLWLTLQNEWTSYAALLALSRRLIADRSADWLNISKLSAELKELLPLKGKPLWRAAATLLNNLYRFSPQDRPVVERLAQEIAVGLHPPATDHFIDELFLAPDE